MKRMMWRERDRSAGKFLLPSYGNNEQERERVNLISYDRSKVFQASTQLRIGPIDLQRDIFYTKMQSKNRATKPLLVKKIVIIQLALSHSSQQARAATENGQTTDGRGHTFWSRKL